MTKICGVCGKDAYITIDFSVDYITRLKTRSLVTSFCEQHMREKIAQLTDELLNP